MNLHHVFREGIFSLLILQEWFSRSACENWSFRFPRTVKVLKRSSATVPCSFTSPAGYGDVNIIWYIYDSVEYPQAFNKKSPSEVEREYRGRTSLVGDGPNSCSLRINDVKNRESFYPGIDKNTNSYFLHGSRTVTVSFTGCSEDSSCSDWSFRFPESINVSRGSCVEIPCSFSHPKGYKDFNLIWYEANGNSPIYNKLNPWDVAAGYSGRTYLVGNGTNSCSLRMNDVKESGSYYPGVNEDINSYVLNDGRSIRVIVTDDHTYIFVTVGVVCFVLCLLIVGICWRWRNRCSWILTCCTRTAQPTESTYADLTKSDICLDYDILKPGVPRKAPVQEKPLDDSSTYENVSEPKDIIISHENANTKNLKK
ncbi:sialic acid-binding Ig-like lectin 12 [Spea bombifrons]|uniref:sialic acid-binding Ig-like lectin 12 n=1 Tax=Spea bombifrons TaxID=233779 RepID=UPI00234922A7|nr:sialic acid-binding Ig-like lectin 12 [Spea bombifrons]